MPTWLKILLIIGGLIVALVIVTVVAGVIVARKYGPQLVEMGKNSIEEGEEFGRGTDNEGCLNEAVARNRRVGGFGDAIKNTLFLPACLEASRPTPGFCDGVPRPFEFIRGAQWQLQQCRRYGLRPEQQCAQIFQQVQQFCERPHARPDAASDNSNADAEPPPPPAPRRTPNTP